ncbi:MAG: HEAT repeat domain-containing protein [Deltaproteobacteria bacterium]|nr:HEAT repeat domain-containing protein [Deltaproteobacteria bacterium]
MDATLRHKLLAYLGGAAIAMSSGPAAGAGSELARVPETIIADLLGEVDEECWGAQDLASLAGVLAEDPRRRVRRRAAELLGRADLDISAVELEPLLERLGQDEDPAVRRTLARTVARWLGRQTGLERARAVLEWALSDRAAIRRALAGALSHGVTALGDDLAIEQLGCDPSPEVRAAVVEAVGRRLQQDPALYLRLLERLTSDEAPAVRRSARRAAARLHLS